MPVPALAIKILSVILAVILVISLTLYVLGRMPARGFWVLVVILAVIAFGVLPWMRRKFCGA
jgi:polyferredoxin